MHISPLVIMRWRMRKREVSEQARKIWAPRSMLKCFSLTMQNTKKPAFYDRLGDS